jgi:hypothetical protein
MNPYLLTYLIGAALTLWVFALGRINTPAEQRPPLHVAHALMLLLMIALWPIAIFFALHMAYTTYRSAPRS